MASKSKNNNSIMSVNDLAQLEALGLGPALSEALASGPEINMEKTIKETNNDIKIANAASAAKTVTKETVTIKNNTATKTTSANASTTASTSVSQDITTMTLISSKTIARRFFFTSREKTIQAFFDFDQTINTYTFEEDGISKKQVQTVWALTGLKKFEAPSRNHVVGAAYRDYLSTGLPLHIECFVANQDLVKEFKAKSSFPFPVMTHLDTKATTKRTLTFTCLDINKFPGKQDIFKAIELLKFVSKGKSVKEIATMLYGYSEKSKVEKAAVTRWLNQVIG